VSYQHSSICLVDRDLKNEVPSQEPEKEGERG